MKKNKIILTGIILSVIFVGSVSVYAATNYETKLKTLANLTGKNTEEITKEMQDENKVFCEIADEYNVLDEFRNTTSTNQTPNCDGTGIRQYYGQGRKHQNGRSEENTEKHLNCNNYCMYNN